MSIEGVAHVVNNRVEKAMMFESLMQKLQPEGGYKPFSDDVYDKALKATVVVKIVPTHTSCKAKFGQHLSEERFEMILTHLKERGSNVYSSTIELMKEMKDGI